MSMTCEQFRQGHPSRDPAAVAHLAACAECRTFAKSWDLLGDYPAMEPSADYFRGVRRKLAPRILRFAAPIAAAAAALLVAILLTHTPQATQTVAGPAVTEEERELVENLDLIQNYELLRTLELVGENGSPLVDEKK
jgi:hypothetical protein